MKLSAALEYEKLRQEKENWNKIYLHKDGKFFRAYEWSAWLIKTAVCTEEFQKERGDAKMLSANRYVTKKGEYASVGFPLESLSKYMPIFDNVDFEAIDDYAEFAVPMRDDVEVKYDDLLASFEEWKRSLPEKETKQSERKPTDRNVAGIDTQNGRVGMFQILSQVLSYPIESRTPSENADFIALLKRQLSSLL